MGSVLSFGCVVSVEDAADIAWTDIETCLPQAGRDATVRTVVRYKISRDGSGSYRLERNRRPIVSAVDRVTLLIALQTDAAWQVARRSRVPAFVHAGMVAVNGQGLLVPGKSGAGKTTLVSALLRQGGVYFSDEYAPIDRDGTIYPFPLYLKIKDGEHEVRRMPWRAFGAETATGPVPVRLIVFPQFAAGASLDLTPLPPGEAAFRLLAHMPASRRFPDAAFSAAAAVVANSHAFSLRHGDANALAHMLIHQLAIL